MIKKSLKNALLYASATVGVGMLSGKENQLFVGGTANVMLFAVVFACANFLFGEWARQTNCRDGESLCTATFGKGAPLALFLLLAADTLTATAILSGTESALQKLTINFPLPMFGVVICLVAAALSKGRGRAASIAARVSLALAAILLAATIGSDYRTAIADKDNGLRYVLRYNAAGAAMQKSRRHGRRKRTYCRTYDFVTYVDSFAYCTARRNYTGRQSVHCRSCCGVFRAVGKHGRLRNDKKFH